jgi:hypothetical protein
VRRLQNFGLEKADAQSERPIVIIPYTGLGIRGDGSIALTQRILWRLNRIEPRWLRQSSLQTHIATTESVSLCAPMKS